MIGGVIAWRTECRFKHLGSEKYLELLSHEDLKKRAEENAKKKGKKAPILPDTTDGWHVSLTREYRSPATLFLLHPVDKVRHNT